MEKEQISLEDATVIELSKLYTRDYLMESPVKVGVVKKYRVEVNTDDAGYIPHFHIVDDNTRGKEFDCCVMIEKPMYFSHGKHKDKLTNLRDRKALDSFLREEFFSPRFRGTNWDYIVFIWNQNNSIQTVNEDLEQPDYNNIEEYKK